MRPSESTALHSALTAPRSLVRAVVCGSFRRDLPQLQADFDELHVAGCLVLSPLEVDFVAEIDGFVLGAGELHETPKAVEARHIASLQQADFVWLHAPDGYVGPSAALELGVAHALGIPVFARTPPADMALRDFVEAVGGVEQALARALVRGTHTPARPLDVLQDYYGRVAASRGYDHESAQDTMLLLTEEIGELARAVRKQIGLKRAGGYPTEGVADELADVQLYLLHLANVLDIRLADAVSDKERVNAQRETSALAA
jgi:NTP pyrophosphatase (non-canonical NTP hydrolase)